MCGIIGVLGTHEVSPLLVEALKRLEYRGYDSAGIATLHEGRLDRRRAVGKLVNLSDHLVHNPLPGKAGIGHTRWATHGAPTTENAHPHTFGRVAVVHNGIIENFRELRAELADHGIMPATETDTETIALLTEFHLRSGLSPVEAAAATIAKLEGAYGLAFLFDGEPDLMIGARQGSPLAIGYGEGEMYLGSDAIALAHLTDKVSYLEDGDIAVLTRDGAEIRDAAGTLANREVKTTRMENLAIDKRGHKHFMAKEIAEQPVTLGDALGAWITPDYDGTHLGDVGLSFEGVSRVVIVACGTAYLSGFVAKYWIEQLARLPVEVDIASEFRYREPPVPKGTLAIFISQSGETADTLAALKYLKAEEARTVAIVNSPESSIAREADICVPIHAGVEVGVASTKAFTSMLAVLAAIAIEAATSRGTLDAAERAAHLANLRTLPGLMNTALADEERYAAAGRKLAEAKDILFLGRGAMYPLALEGALKLKEISYIHAEGYASGELKHGPIALVDDKTPIVVMAPQDALFEKTVSNMQEVMARGGRILLITDSAGAEIAGDGVWETVIMPRVDPLWAPILYALPAQLLAYHTAVAKGTDVDQPRNLAKSVTVE